jgi:hypothetical protein
MNHLLTRGISIIQGDREKSVKWLFLTGRIRQCFMKETSELTLKEGIILMDERMRDRCWVLWKQMLRWSLVCRLFLRIWLLWEEGEGSRIAQQHASNYSEGSIKPQSTQQRAGTSTDFQRSGVTEMAQSLWATPLSPWLVCCPGKGYVGMKQLWDWSRHWKGERLDAVHRPYSPLLGPGKYMSM